MLWTRAKAILIAVLLLVNLFLFGIAASIQNQKVRLSDSYLDDAVVQLGLAGVQIDRAVLPDRRCFLPQITISSREMLVPLARALLEDAALEPLSEPEGNRYENDFGSVVLQQEGLLLYRPQEPPVEVGALLRPLEQAGFDKNDLVPSEVADALQLLVAGVPVDGCGLLLRGGEIYGRLLLTGTRETVYKTLLDPPNALLRFAAETAELPAAERQIILMETVYQLQQGGRYSSLILTPAYRITTPSGVWLVGAQSGTVDKASPPLDEALPDAVS